MKKKSAKKKFYETENFLVSFKIIGSLFILSLIMGLISLFEFPQDKNFLSTLPFSNTSLISLVSLFLISTFISYKLKKNEIGLKDKLNISAISCAILILVSIIIFFLELVFFGISFTLRLSYIFQFTAINIFYLIIRFFLIFISLDFFHKDLVIKKNSNRNIIYSNFLKSLGFIKFIRSYIFVAGIILLFLSLFAYQGYMNDISPYFAEKINSFMKQSIEEIIKQTEGLSPLELTIFIINNNIKTALFSLVSGIFLTVSSIFVVIFNGYILGFAALSAVNNPKNLEGIFVLWRLFPHGIFELPAILISVGLGIRLGLTPLYLKNKLKGLMSLIVSFVIFFFLSGIVMGIMSLFKRNTSPEKFLPEILKNPVISIVFFLVIITCYVISIVIGIKMLERKDREAFIKIIADSLIAFVFIVVPLLVIAGIIEGILIFVA